MHNIDQIRVLDIESTNTCNASCPQCLRTNEHSHTESVYNDVLDFDAVLKNTPREFWRGLKEINFNGNTGDNIAHPDIQRIVAKTVELAPNAVIKIMTNGGLRNQAWWSEFGSALANTQCVVIFGIDGLADTHSLYRVGTVWQRVIDHASAFIAAGGRAVWQMIPFAHNQHQIEQCRALSKELGFIQFVIRSENRFPAGQTSQPVYFKQKHIHTIQAPSVAITSDICQSMESADAGRTVQCKSQQTNWLAIYADGTLWPCCFLMGWHRSPHQGRFYTLINHHFRKILGLDLSTISLYTNTLQEILDSDIWKKNYPDSFKNKPNPVCLQQCAL